MRHWALPLAVALAALPGTTGAQEPLIGPAPVRACLEAARPHDRGAPACAGAAARACQQRPGGDTTLGITDCLMAETAIWDDLMQAELARQTAILRAAGGDGLVAQLTASQHAWAAYRDAQCGLVYGIWRDGSIRTIMAGECQLSITARRAVELRHLGGME